MSYIDFDELEEQHGTEKAIVLFEQFKITPPTYEISPAFAEQVIRELPEGFAAFDHAEHGLVNPDSDIYLEWCQHYYFLIPSIDAKAFVEVGDYYYYVSLDVDSVEYCGETFKHWEDVVQYIQEATASISTALVTE